MTTEKCCFVCGMPQADCYARTNGPCCQNCDHPYQEAHRG
jgi:hypothetical protein